MYYKARKINYPPYLIFDKVAYSKEEAISRGIISDDKLKPGVVLEKDIPPLLYGISTSDQDDYGNLIPRAEEEFKQAQKEIEKEQYMEEIQSLKAFLADTDWIITKCFENGILTKEAYPEEIEKRQNARSRINILEKYITL